MERKLVQQGQSTLMISLPRSWIVEQGLKRGSEVSISQEAGAVVIRAKGSARVREISLTLVGEDESLVRTLITNAYRTGIEKIHVTFGTQAQYSLLSQTVKTKLLGFQITHKEKKSCVIESITEPDATQFENILSKFFLSIKQMLEIALCRAENKQVEEDIDELEDRIMQYENFCLRCLSREARSSSVDFLQLVIHNMNHGQRDCYHALSSLKKSSLDAQLVKYCAQIVAILMDAYTRKTTEKLHEIHLIEENEKKLLRKPLTLTSHHLASAVRFFYLANSPLAGWIILQSQNKVN